MYQKHEGFSLNFCTGLRLLWRTEVSLVCAGDSERHCGAAGDESLPRTFNQVPP